MLVEISNILVEISKIFVEISNMFVEISNTLVEISNMLVEISNSIMVKTSIKMRINHICSYRYHSFRIFEQNESFYSDNSKMSSCSRNAQFTFVEKPQLKIISLQNYKHWYLIRTWSDKAYMGTVVNRVLALFKRRVAWNYAYSPFKGNFHVTAGVQFTMLCLKSYPNKKVKTF